MKLPLVLPDGRVYLGGIGVDQTDTLRTNAERDLLATVVEQVSESVMIADLDARITYVNPAFERVSGYTSAGGPRKEPAHPQQRRPAALLLRGDVGGAHQWRAMGG